VTRRGGVVTSAGGKATPGGGMGGDNASWADVNLIGPKNKEKSRVNSAPTNKG
jgi:hypothetical protein